MPYFELTFVITRDEVEVNVFYFLFGGFTRALNQVETIAPEDVFVVRSESLSYVNKFTEDLVRAVKKAFVVLLWNDESVPFRSRIDIQKG
jgi:hypothetical protein